MTRNWERIRRNPVPSLLASLLEDHLDPGYADSARKGTRTPQPAARIWLGAGLVLTGLVLGIGYAQNEAAEAGTDRTRTEILASLRAGEERTATLVEQRDALTGAIDDRRAALFGAGSDGSSLLDELRAAESAAGTTPAHGPGLTVTLTEPPAKPNLSDASERTGTAGATILDRDLQSVVNALWAAGAEAVGVGGVRIGPGVTIRQAGGATLVDNQPVFSPYTISAIGAAGRLQTSFVVSDAYLRMSGIQQLYGVGFTLREEDDIELPPAAARELGTSGETGNR